MTRSLARVFRRTLGQPTTLAWMLGVDADSLEVDEPAPPPSLSTAELTAALGI